jgi:hypothetical protein
MPTEDLRALFAESFCTKIPPTMPFGVRSDADGDWFVKDYILKCFYNKGE